VILSAIADKLKRRSKDDLLGRGAGYPAPPPQIPGCGMRLSCTGLLSEVERDRRSGLGQPV